MYLSCKLADCRYDLIALGVPGSDIAAVAEKVPSDFCWRATSSQTLPWSERWPRFSATDLLTDIFKKCRSFEGECVPLVPKCLERYAIAPVQRN